MTTTRPHLAPLVAVLLAITLVGCAPGPNTTSPGDSAPPTPTAACPEIEGVDLPPQCAPYDPDAAMAANDRYRERNELDETTQEANVAVVTTVRDSLAQVGAAGATVDGVERALTDAGLLTVQIRKDYNRILFGAVSPAGGCIYGEVSEAGITVDAGGFILDGGCLPAQ